MRRSLLLFPTALVAAQSTGTNVFATNRFYVDPYFQKNVDDATAGVTDPATLANLGKMRQTSTAHWITKKSVINTTEPILKGAASQSPPPLVVFVVYNLPNRDCDADNSLGEFCCATKPDGSCDYLAEGDCSAGLSQYKNDFIDPIAAVVAKYADKVPMAFVLEPSSIPNLATNKGNPKCATSATEASYTKGIPMAVDALAAAAPKASIYIDAAHGGWLGWEANAQAYATLFSTLQVTAKVRGLATNMGNFQPLGVPCPASAFDDSMHNYCGSTGGVCCEDPCALLPQFSSGNNEYNYIQALTKEIKRAIPYWDPHYIIDTSRNGITDERSSCASWCNVRGAGLGKTPSSNNLLPNLVDALFYLKTPGESDGCTETLPDGSTCHEYDKTCGDPDAIGSQPGEPKAPVSGTFWNFYAVSLAKNAQFVTIRHNSSQFVAQSNKTAQLATQPGPILVAHKGSFGGSAHLAMTHQH